MTPLVDSAKNLAADAVTIDTLSLHSAYPGAAGTSNELSGGSPAYARGGVTVNAASSGARALASDEAFDVPSGATVAFIGKWSGSTYRGYAPNGPASNVPVAAGVEASTDELLMPGHGFANDETVIVFPTAGASLPAGLTEGTIYYVINSDANSIELSLTQGGSAVNITGDGGCMVQQIITETFGAQGTHTVKAGTILQF